jgi:hypothetical protein
MTPTTNVHAKPIDIFGLSAVGGAAHCSRQKAHSVIQEGTRATSVNQPRDLNMELFCKLSSSIHKTCRKHEIFRFQRRCSSFYVSTPIFYVNSVPHIGHLHSTVLADVLARWNRLQGKNVIFSTGTDEHGLKIQNAADAKNMSPKEFCDKVSTSFRQMCAQTSISHTDFIRTTEHRHKIAVDTIWVIVANFKLIPLEYSRGKGTHLQGTTRGMVFHFR